MTQSSEGQVIKTTHFFGLIASKHFHILSFPGDLCKHIFSYHQKVFQGTGNESLNIWKFPVGQTSLLFILEAKALFPNDFEIFLTMFKL